MIDFANRRLWLGIAVAGLVQSAALGWMVWDRVQLLRNGQEAVLETIPVDPRSLFRGDYVIMSYAFGSVKRDLFPGTVGLQSGQTVYVGLVRENGMWRAGAAGMDRAALAAHRDGPVLKGRIQRNWFDRTVRSAFVPVRFGIESYFVSEGKGRELEKLVGERKIAAIVAVDAKGNAAIKGLQIDGKRVYDEPLL